MDCRKKILLKTGLIVPCGKCPACRANNRQEWVFRLKQEYLNCSFALFVTLTYNDENLPKDLSVNKKHIQLFHKRLRKHFAAGELRFFLVSEYGDHGHRPHYHGLYFFKSLHDYNKVYDIFCESWSNGFINFGDVTIASILYCTKYCLKGSDVPEGRKPNFRLLSKMNGGLGYNYLEKMSSYHIESGQFSFVSMSGSRSRMPRYYRDKLRLVNDIMNPDSVLDRLEEQAKRANDEFNKRYFEFLKRNNLVHCTESMRKFNEFNSRRVLERDSLILKHTKKQNIL